MILEDLGGRILEDLGGSWMILNRRKFTQTSPRVNMCVCLLVLVDVAIIREIIRRHHLYLPWCLSLNGAQVCLM